MSSMQMILNFSEFLESVPYIYIHLKPYEKPYRNASCKMDSSEIIRILYIIYIKGLKESIYFELFINGFRTIQIIYADDFSFMVLESVPYFDGCATVQDTNMLCAVKLLQMLFTR